ncbi:SIR2 family protein [Microbacterium sp.]|uniref:SIR2 family protein n=1 Tax=Microbacterium sp. TaxID=51671 RepID=UPI003F6FCBD7
MSAPDISAELMDQLKGSGGEKHTTLFLGAGASTTSGLPDWDTLVTRLLLAGKSVPDAATAQLLLARQDPLMVAEAARAAHGGRWNQKLRRALYEGVIAMEASPLHLAATRHLLEGDTHDTTLATLNFDNLLEQVILHERPDKSVGSRTTQEVPDCDYIVHHLHGVVTPSEVGNCVLTLTEFLDLIGDEEAWQRTFLAESLEHGALVIAGTSYRDPDIRQWLHAAVRRAPDTHAAMVLLARQGFGVSKSEFEAMRTSLTAQWERVGVRAVLMEDFSDAAQVIRELRVLGREGYLSPQARSKAVWTHHADRFVELQERFSTQLEADASRIAQEMDAAALNASLWLARGDGTVVRWASQDRTYRDLDALRAVPTGFDSPWVAGKAVSADALLFQNLETLPTRRWRSVLAAPLPVSHPTLPEVTTAVLTIGLPETAEAYDDSRMLWGPVIGEVSNQWSERLGETFV